MKTLAPILLVLLVGCARVEPPAQPAPKQYTVVEAPKPEGCEIETYSDLVAQHDVGPITNLIKEPKEGGLNGECTVKFDITVNGKLYHLERKELGWEQTASLCHYAQQKARQELLLSLPGEFVAKTKVACYHTEDTNG